MSIGHLVHCLQRDGRVVNSQQDVNNSDGQRNVVASSLCLNMSIVQTFFLHNQTDWFRSQQFTYWQ